MYKYELFSVALIVPVIRKRVTQTIRRTYVPVNYIQTLIIKTKPTEPLDYTCGVLEWAQTLKLSLTSLEDQDSNINIFLVFYRDNHSDY